MIRNLSEYLDTIHIFPLEFRLADCVVCIIMMVVLLVPLVVSHCTYCRLPSFPEVSPHS